MGPASSGAPALPMFQEQQVKQQDFASKFPTGSWKGSLCESYRGPRGIESTNMILEIAVSPARFRAAQRNTGVPSDHTAALRSSSLSNASHKASMMWSGM